LAVLFAVAAPAACAMLPNTPPTDLFMKKQLEGMMVDRHE
jgi:hypothetical protein